MSVIRYAKHSHSRKFGGKCEQCDKVIDINQSYCYVDDTNANINYYAKYLCKECYEKTYNDKIGERE